MVIADFFTVLVVDRGDRVVAINIALTGVLGIKNIAFGLLANFEVVGEPIKDANGARSGDTGNSERRGDHGGNEHARQGAEANEPGKSREHTTTRNFLGRHMINSKGSLITPR